MEQIFPPFFALPKQRSLWISGHFLYEIAQARFQATGFS